MRRWVRLSGAALGLLLASLATVSFFHAELLSPPQSFLVRDRHGRFLAEAGVAPDAEVGFWPLSSAPHKIEAATLAAEDRRFWNHTGVDFYALGRAVWQWVSGGSRSGASTLAMQVARMQRPGERTVPRKLMEALTAIWLVQRHGRDAVLAHYLRIAPYGNRAHGVVYAARRYLDKPVEDLSWAEAAFLAALPQAPGRMNPLTPSGYAAAARRGKRILTWLRERGELDASEHQAALQQIDHLLVPRQIGTRSNAALHAVLRIDALLRDPASSAAFAHRPIVESTLDLDLQRTVSAAVRASVEAWDADGVGNAAAVLLDAMSGEVLAWVGSSGYFDAEHAGAIDYTGVPRSPGSTLKPFLYALALDRGVITPASVLDDLDRAEGEMGNADDAFLGPLIARTALANSRNTTAVTVLLQTGFDESYALLERLGLYSTSDVAERYGPGLAIGNGPVTLDRLVRGYSVFPRQGMLSELTWMKGQPIPAPRRVLSEASARHITQFLSDPMARLPSFPRMGATEFPFPVAVKTGTSSGYRDAWAVAWSKRYLLGVWVGHPDWRPMRRLSGFRSAAELAARLMRHLHRGEADGLADLSFPPPVGSVPVRLCALSGALAGEECDRTLVEHLAPGDAPVGTCEVHVRRAVDTRNGLLATARTPKRFVEVRTFVDLAPRYAQWAAAAGLVPPPETPSPIDLRGQYLSAAPLATPRLLNRHEQPEVRVASPRDGQHLLRDPETPAEQLTLALRAIVEPPVAQLVWYVDGVPFAVVDHPFVARWPLSPGEHSFQARVPHQEAASAVVRVLVE